MATANRVTVGATAVRLDQNTADNQQGHRVIIRNTETTATNAINLGGSNVTSTTGFTLAGGAQIELVLNDPETVYGIRASGAALDPTVHVLHLS